MNEDPASSQAFSLSSRPRKNALLRRHPQNDFIPYRDAGAVAGLPVAPQLSEESAAAPDDQQDTPEQEGTSAQPRYGQQGSGPGAGQLPGAS